MSLPNLSERLREAVLPALDRFLAVRGVQAVVFTVALALFWLLDTGVAHAL